MLRAAFVLGWVAVTGCQEGDPSAEDGATPIADGGVDGTGRWAELPPAIDPGDFDFGRIVRETRPDGGVIVLPDGEYTASDVNNFNPTAYVIVVAEHPGAVDIVRGTNAVGETAQSFRDSSHLVFVGLNFKYIVTRVVDSAQLYFWHTTHTYPVTQHPDPRETYCGNGQGPNGLEIINADDLGVFGSRVVGIGHDGIKLSSTRNVTIRGVEISELDHGSLQQGRGNERCGWDGDDNYHDDAIQIYPGGVENLTIEESYLGRHAILQVDNGGASNENIVVRNNWFFQEPPKTDCLGLDVRVKSGAQADAIQTMTVENNQVWCRDSQWVFYVGGTRDGSLRINGNPIPSSAREANEYLTRRTGTPQRAEAPAAQWRKKHSINTWPCYLSGEADDFQQGITTCE